MYERFYGLNERPFELTPNPQYLFLTDGHREALATLQYGLASRRGIVAVIGEAGTGKSTILQAAMQRRTRARAVVLNNPSLTRGEFLEMVAYGFGLSPEAAISKATLLRELTAAVVAQREAGIVSALIVDEAHCLPDELLEEIRLLANIETTREKLLCVVLAGQPELATRLNEPGLRQLKQRVALRTTLVPLTLDETRSYIDGRVRIAGARTALFTPAAVELIAARARGIPRTISVICDNALVTGFAAGLPRIDAATVVEVCRDFDLPGEAVVPDGAPVRLDDWRPSAAGGER
jgi:general secretion pathway protein A